MWQVALLGNECGQLLVSEKGGPLLTMLLNVTGKIPTLRNVTVMAALVVPTTWGGNDKLWGLTVSPGPHLVH
jgi:hypothetical protein